MDNETKTDVKGTAESSPATKTDVKRTEAFTDIVNEVFAKHAESPASGAKSAEKGAGLQETKTGEEGAGEESDQAATDSTEQEGGAEEQSGEGEQTNEDAEGAEGEETEEGDNETAEGGEDAEEGQKQSEAVPYNRFQEVNQQLQQARPYAEAHAQLEAYLKDLGVTPEEWQNTLDLLALRKRNPAEAAKRLSVELESLQVATGAKLPADLVAKVEAGTLSEEDAKEIAALRAKANGAEQNTQSAVEAAKQQFVKSVTSAMQAWGANKKQLDPAFKPKKDAKAPDGKFEVFQGKLTLLVQNSPPRDAAEAVALAEQAYAETQALFKRFSPAPATKKVLRLNGSGKREIEPKTPEEVTEQIARKWGAS
jgi:hypothetical protein